MLCIIFDIDGTLVDSSAFEYELFCAAITDVLGDVSIRAKWNEYEHVTDAGIVAEIICDNGLEAAGKEREIRARFGELIAAFLSGGGTCPETHGAIALLDTLRHENDLVLGIATGGWGHTAMMKLERAGFAVDGIPFASSDDHQHRVEIMRNCRAQLPPTSKTVYIGDGEWDRQASNLLGWAFIGVGAQLQGNCDHWIPDLSRLRLAELY